MDIYRLVDQLVAERAGVIFISYELPEMIGMSDRIIGWRDGEIIGTVTRAEANKEIVLKMISGA